MIQHAVGIGRGSEQRRQAHVIEHAAYGVFLKKLLARDIRLGLEQPPPKKAKGQEGQEALEAVINVVVAAAECCNGVCIICCFWYCKNLIIIVEEFPVCV